MRTHKELYTGESFRVAGSYAISKDYSTVTATGPEHKPYLRMDESLGRELNKRGHSCPVHLTFDAAGHAGGLVKDDSPVRPPLNGLRFLVFASFHHHRLRIVESTNVNMVKSFGSRYIIIMNNVNSEFTFSVPHKEGLSYRCWVDQYGLVSTEALEVGYVG